MILNTVRAYLFQLFSFPRNICHHRPIPGKYIPHTVQDPTPLELRKRRIDPKQGIARITINHTIIIDKMIHLRIMLDFLHVLSPVSSKQHIPERTIIGMKLIFICKFQPGKCVFPYLKRYPCNFHRQVRSLFHSACFKLNKRYFRHQIFQCICFVLFF